jgi:hypothetical protein
MSYIDSDPTLAVGDFVFHTYSKNELLWKITKIERRFLTKDDLKYSVYENGKVGDEYNPYVSIESVADFSIKANVKKKMRKTKKGFDAAYLVKVDPKLIQEHVQRLKQLVVDLWG